MSPSLSDYRPKTSLKEDALNRRELVDVISDIITSSNLSDSLTIGIIGKWGSGKTTVVNFVKESIQNKNIIFIDFNPWRYSSQDNLSEQLLNLLSYYTLKNNNNKFHRYLKKISMFLSKISILTPDPGLSELLEYFSRLLRDNTEGIPLDELKNNISTKFKESNYKYVIVIDDVDRLDPEEIRMVMKLVRSVADFSNTIYILCYDDDIVNNALTTDSYSGQKYLQKIINIPIRLPEYALHIPINYLIKCYIETIRRSDLNDYEIGIVHCFRSIAPSMRDVQTIAINFQNLFIISRNNTCPIDLLALTLIDIMDSRVFIWISQNRDRLCGTHLPSITSLMSGEREDISKLYKQDEQNPIFIDLMSILFPYFKLKHYIQPEVKMEYRICDRRYIDNYFLLTPSSLDVPDHEVESIIMNESPQYFFNVMSKLDSGIVSEIIYRVCDKIDKNPEWINHAERICKFILLQPFDNRTHFEFDYFIRFTPIVELYLNSLPSTDEKIKFLISVEPQDDLHKIIFYGAIINRLFKLIDDENEVCLITSLSSSIKDLICSFKDYSDIKNPSELLLMIILISWTNKDTSKKIFLKIMPEYEQRKHLYESLNSRGLSADFLTELVGDPTHSNWTH